ncbi:MAG: molybdate ABC transporter substrate-binding protein [Alphaproteobacteria bacterium]|nr:molybdate ABC transporter substrate-binding protein [Alphaproteobacteria bacterium]
MLLSGPLANGACAGDVRIAVAANFTQAAREIGAAFQAATGNRPIFSFGSTGQLYAQITQDAPFEVFLAADQARPRKAVENGLALGDSRFTYATGKITLFSKMRDLVAGEATLRDGRFTRLAIANPDTAPYGAAAVAAIKALGLYQALKPKIVQGNNIAQTYQFVATGNAELGFVALSQVIDKAGGSRWAVPEHLYRPIAQDAVLTRRGADSETARAFLVFLRGPEARAVKEKYGYGAGD